MRYSTYELKYCERCGGLGLRRNKSGLPYCCECEQMMRRFLPRPAAASASPGQLRRIVQRLGHRGLATSSRHFSVEGAAHAS